MVLYKLDYYYYLLNIFILMLLFGLGLDWLVSVWVLDLTGLILLLTRQVLVLARPILTKSLLSSQPLTHLVQLSTLMHEELIIDL